MLMSNVERLSPRFPISLPALALSSEASALLAQDNNITLLHPLFFFIPSCTVPSVLKPFIW